MEKEALLELILYGFGILVICFVLYQLLFADPIDSRNWIHLRTKKGRAFQEIVTEIDGSLQRIRERHRSDFIGTVTWSCRTKRFPFYITLRKGSPHELTATFDVKAPEIPQQLQAQIVGGELEVQDKALLDNVLRPILERLRFFDGVSIHRKRITVRKELDSAQDLESWPDAFGGALTLARYILDYEKAPELPANTICPYCRETIEKGQSLVFCKECHTIHHHECWNETDRCTVFGCSGSTEVSI